MTKKTKMIELKPGDLIQHTTQDFGEGRVMDIKDGMAMISFKKLGKRRYPAGSRFLKLVEPTESDDHAEAEADDVESPDAEPGEDPKDPT